MNPHHIVAIAALSAACGGSTVEGSDASNSTDASDSPTPDARPAADAAGSPDASLGDPVTINFGAKVDNLGTDAACGQTFTGIGLSDANVQLRDLRFFVSNIRMLGAGGDVPLSLAPGPFQTSSVALLDFENGSGGCAGGTAEMHTAITGFAAPGTYTGVAFDIGLPFADGHSSLAASGPLSVPSMFVNEKLGRRSMRVDLTVNGTTNWDFHLIARDCGAGADNMAPAAECAKPSRPEYSFPAFNPETQTIVFWFDALFADTNVSVNGGGGLGCLSTDADAADCDNATEGGIYGLLGLDFVTGLCEEGCNQQDTFTAETNP